MIIEATRKMEASLEAFGRLYREHGVEVSWAKHDVSTLTGEFIAQVLRRSKNPLVYDLGCGEGGKAFYIARSGIRVIGFDANSVAVEIASRQAQELDLNAQVSFQQMNITELNPEVVSLAQGVHDYQCINHIARDYHPGLVDLIASLLVEGGVFLTNTFSNYTNNFYGEDISNRGNGEFIFQFDPNNPHHRGKKNLDGMYCYFFSEDELIKLYSPQFVIENMRRVPHPYISGRFHWETLMTKK